MSQYNIIRFFFFCREWRINVKMKQTERKHEQKWKRFAFIFQKKKKVLGEIQTEFSTTISLIGLSGIFAENKSADYNLYRSELGVKA